MNHTNRFLKLLLSVLTVLLCCSLCSCAILSPIATMIQIEADKADADGDSDDRSEPNNYANGTPLLVTPALNNVTVNDNANFTATVTGLTNGNGMLKISMSFQSKIRTDLTINHIFLTLNGYQFDSHTFLQLAAQSSAVTEETFYIKNEEMPIIGTVGEYGFAFEYAHADSFSLAKNLTKLQTVKTEFYDSWQASEAPARASLIAEKKFSLEALKTAKTGKYGNTTVYFVLKNLSNTALTVDIDQVVIQGKVDSEYLSYTVAPSQTVLIPIVISRSDLREAGISQVSTVGIQLDIEDTSHNDVYANVVNYTLETPITA